MEKSDLGHHISQQFNAELEEIRSRVLAMGGIVEQQIHKATQALVEGDIPLAESVIDNDTIVNNAEVTIDEECATVIARRQPTASDLRLLVAVIKTITDLERIGDQAERVARMAIRLAEQSNTKVSYMEVRHMGERVAHMVHNSLDAFARLDVEAAVEVAKEDQFVDVEYDGIMRQSLTYMMEDPHTITQMLDIMWSVRALERIGDHAKNICEYVIYLVKGKDVRHISLKKLEKAVKKGK